MRLKLVASGFLILSVLACNSSDKSSQPSQHSPQPSQHSSQPSQHSPQPSQHSPQPSQYSPQPSQYSPQPSQHSPQPPQKQLPSQRTPNNTIQLTTPTKDVPPKLKIDPTLLPSLVDAKNELDQLSVSWRRNAVNEEQVDRNLSHLLNQKFFDITKMNTSNILTPSDFLISQKGFPIRVPIPISRQLTNLEEGFDYSLNLGNFRKVLYPIPGENKFFKKGNKLYVKLAEYDNGLNETLVINGKEFQNKDGKTYQLQENDLVFTKRSNQLDFLFKVLLNGEILLPADEARREALPLSHSISVAAMEQSNEFNVNGKKQTKFKFTTGFFRAEVDETTKLLNGFHTISKHDHNYFDLNEDKILSQVLNYLDEEMKLFNFTLKQKAFRIAQMIYSLVDYDHRAADDESTHGIYGFYGFRNFLIGEYLNAGKGVCRHIAVLFKIMADHQGLNCALVSSSMNATLGSGHSWNYCLIDGEYILVDPTQAHFIDLKSINQTDTEFKKLINYYGIPEGLLKKN